MLLLLLSDRSWTYIYVLPLDKCWEDKAKDIWWIHIMYEFYLPRTLFSFNERMYRHVLKYLGVSLRGVCGSQIQMVFDYG